MRTTACILERRIKIVEFYIIVQMRGRGRYRDFKIGERPEKASRRREELEILVCLSTSKSR